MSHHVTDAELAAAAPKLQAWRGALNTVLFGQEMLVDQVITALLARGHLLLEGLPGLGKTELVKGLAKALQLEARRIQFTPDLLPGDITGNPILQEENGKRQFVFQPGPLFANLVLADEINRASPKTQSALLEAMQERRVTVMGHSHPLPDPFFVLATQNPIELEGTYPLPEAQLDRFLFKLEVQRNGVEVLTRIVQNRQIGVEPQVDSVLTREELLHLAALAARVFLPDVVVDYIARLVDGTHTGQSRTAEGIRFGASPRAALGLAAAARGRALLSGRLNASFEDVQAVALPVLQHRIVLDYHARIDGLTPAGVVRALLEEIPAQNRATPAVLSATPRMSHRIRRTLLLCAVLLSSLAVRARAGLEQPVATVDDSGVRIVVTGPINEVPPGGAFPCRVTVQNHSGAARTWNLRLQEHAASERGDRIAVSQSLRVENDASGTATLLLPLLPPPATVRWFYRNVTLHVDGYGVEGREVNLATSGSGGSADTAFIAMGETLATPVWASLEKKYRDDLSRILNGAPLDSRQLTADWRALTGFGGIWLTDGEYTALNADQRAALRRWVDAGGTLLLSARALDPSLRAGLGLPEDSDEGHPGYGSVKALPWDGKELDLDVAVQCIDGVKPTRNEPASRSPAAWGMTRSVGKIPLNAGFLLPFIAAFAVLAGPVNLFVFAPASRRHRLFWTTPVISCAGSLLLLVVIVLQDGFGGRGERVMVTRLFPAQRQAVVTQEQVVRTGVLLSRHFQVPEDVLLTPLETPANAGRSFEVAGRDLGGDWFMSRLLQAHRAEAVLPSRAEVQLVNAAEAAGGAAPVVVSSIQGTLREIYYRDTAKAVWRGSNLHTGERVTLHKETDQMLRSLTELSTVVGSPLLTRMQDEALGVPNQFLALADSGPFVETLSSVRWQKQQAVYLGPVTPVR